MIKETFKVDETLGNLNKKMSKQEERWKEKKE